MTTENKAEFWLVLLVVAVGMFLVGVVFIQYYFKTKGLVP